MKMKNLFLFSWKKLLIIIVCWIAAVILHNLFYALTGIEEAVFFIIAVFVIPIYVLIDLVYNLVYFLKKKNSSVKLPKKIPLKRVK